MPHRSQSVFIAVVAVEAFRLTRGSNLNCKMLTHFFRFFFKFTFIYEVIFSDKQLQIYELFVIQEDFVINLLEFHFYNRVCFSLFELLCL